MLSMKVDTNSQPVFCFLDAFHNQCRFFGERGPHYLQREADEIAFIFREERILLDAFVHTMHFKYPRKSNCRRARHEDTNWREAIMQFAGIHALAVLTPIDSNGVVSPILHDSVRARHEIVFRAWERARYIGVWCACYFVTAHTYGFFPFTTGRGMPRAIAQASLSISSRSSPRIPPVFLARQSDWLKDWAPGK